MKVSITDRSKKPIKQQIAELRANLKKAIEIDMTIQMNNLMRNIANEGFVETFRETYNRPRPYRPFRGANKANRKGKMIYVSQKVVSRTGEAKKAFSPIAFTFNGSSVIGRNESDSFECRMDSPIISSNSTAITRKTLVGTISGLDASKLKRRLVIFREGVKKTKQDHREFVNALKANFKTTVSMLRAAKLEAKKSRVK